MTLNVSWPPIYQALQSPVNIPLLPSGFCNWSLSPPSRLKALPPPPCAGPQLVWLWALPLSLLPPPRGTPSRWGSFLLFLPHPPWVPAGGDGPSNTQGSPFQIPRPLPRTVDFGGWQGEVLSAALHQVAVTEDPWAEGACFCAGWGLVYVEPGGCGGQSVEGGSIDSHSCSMWSHWAGALSPLPSLAFFLLETPHLT